MNSRNFPRVKKGGGHTHKDVNIDVYSNKKTRNKF